MEAGDIFRTGRKWNKLVFGKEADENPVYRPLTGCLLGGNGQVVEPHALGAMNVMSDTNIRLADGSVYMFGCGWDTRKSEVHTLLESRGVGLKEPDVDINVFLMNKYGEVVGRVSPKDSTEMHSGVTMGLDNRTGEGEGDDERFVVELHKIHPVVYSLVITISLQEGGDDCFSHVRNMYFRMLDVESSTMEKEVFRYIPDMAKAPDHHRTAVIGRMEKTSEGWSVKTMYNFLKQSHASRPTVLAGDILSAVNAEPIKPCTGTTTMGAQLDAMKSNLLAGTTKLTLSRPPPSIDPKFRHLHALNQSEHGPYNVVFDADGDKDCGIDFHEEAASIVVRSVRDLEYKPKHMQLLKDFASSSPLPKLPHTVRISNLKATIPAADRGGTSDPYIRISYKEYKKGIAFMGANSSRVVRVASKPQKKVKCPSEVTFSGITTDVPITSLSGFLPQCDIEVFDKDKLSKDDLLLKHTIDLTWLFCGTTVEQMNVMPRHVSRIEDISSNAGFGTHNVRLACTLELLF
jgi:stress response protein SCP2